MRFIFKIILFLSLFFVTLFANFQKIDECKSDLYYANGILIQNSKFEAERIWKVKAKELLANNPELRKNIHSYKVAYNHSYGTTSDLFEAFLQKAEAEPGTKVTWEGFKLFIGLKIKKADDLIGLAENVNNSIESYDLTNHINAYKNSIKNGHGVIVISHSQGNLFTNRAYATLDEWMKPYFHNMGVATPAHEVASGGQYVTFDNDPIHHIPNSLDDNLYNENRYYSHTNALGELVEALTGAFHAFDYYLGSPVLVDNVSVSSNKAADKIKSFITEKIQAHSDAPSQWETDQELNKNTKEYRITVKHRFDSSIVTMNGVEVYPFAASKKLYYVDGNISGYVKASCGGYLLEDTWVGQDVATEYARLLHTDATLPHETLKLFEIVSIPDVTLSAVASIYYSEHFDGIKRTIVDKCTGEVVFVPNNNKGYWYGAFYRQVVFRQICAYVGLYNYKDPRDYADEKAKNIELLDSGFQVGFSGLNSYLSTLHSYDIRYGKIYGGNGDSTEKSQTIYLTNIKVRK